MMTADVPSVQHLGVAGDASPTKSSALLPRVGLRQSLFFRAAERAALAASDLGLFFRAAEIAALWDSDLGGARQVPSGS